MPAIDGQVTFDSGWEWSYWLNDVLVANAAWNPHMEVKNSHNNKALFLFPNKYGIKKQLPTTRQAMGALLADVVSYFGPVGQQLSEILLDTIDMERELLIYGRVAGKNPSTVVERNGQAYLEG